MVGCGCPHRSVGTKIINFVEKEEEKLSGWDTMVSLFNFSFLK